MPEFLKTILADKAERLSRSRTHAPLAELQRRCRDQAPPLDFRAALAQGAEGGNGGTTATPPAIIAEFKRRSPSRGEIRRRLDLAEVYRAYRKGGAAACSVLTEEDHFGGTLHDLRTLRGLSDLPLLRKDFLFDPYQIYESRAAGADALLLIVAALQDDRLQELIALSRQLGMEALVEIHTPFELERALAAGAAIIGINNRDLHTFTVDLGVSLQLAAHLQKSAPDRDRITLVSESGIRGPEDIRHLRAAGIHAFLVGEQLMRSADPEAELRRLREDS
jgi:indole-3-glycerol phosphate synthase